MKPLRAIARRLAAFADWLNQPVGCVSPQDAALLRRADLDATLLQLRLLTAQAAAGAANTDRAVAALDRATPPRVNRKVGAR